MVPVWDISNMVGVLWSSPFLVDKGQGTYQGRGVPRTD